MHIWEEPNSSGFCKVRMGAIRGYRDLPDLEEAAKNKPCRW